jgi:ribulose bisphosphate carboxylase small subunit
MTLDILNATTGHSTITFDTGNPEEVKNAESQINDMLKMGYAIFVEHEGQTNRITSFDAAKGVYKVGAREIPAEAPATAVAKPSGGCAGER